MSPKPRSPRAVVKAIGSAREPSKRASPAAVAPSKGTPGSERPSGRPYGGLSEEERRRERRERFIQAGIVVFGRDGFGATTTRGLCAEAGLTQRYFYESFSDLEELFLAVAYTLGERLRKALYRAPDAVGRDPKRELGRALTAYFELLRSDTLAARIMLLEVYTAGTRVGELALRFTDELGRMVRERMELAYPDLPAHGVDAPLMAAALVGATHHLALKWMLGGYREPIRRVVDTALTVYLGAALAVGLGEAQKHLT